MVKLKDLPTVTFVIKQEVFLRLLGVYFHSNPTNWDKQIKSKREGVCTYYECARSMDVVKTLHTISSYFSMGCRKLS